MMLLTSNNAAIRSLMILVCCSGSVQFSTGSTSIGVVVSSAIGSSSSFSSAGSLLSDPQALKDRYQIQLDLYERALTQITGMNVREKLIYAIALKRVITL